MAQTIREVVISISLQQKESKLKVPDFKPYESSVAEVAKAADESRFSLVKLENQADKATRAAAEEQRLVAERVNDLNTRIVDESLKAAEAAKTAGDGLFTLVRGVTLLGDEADEDLQKFVSNLAKVQGAFDIFKGGTDVIKGSIEGFRAFRLATQASASATTIATAANTAQAASNQAVAVTGAAAAASMGSLTLAIAPIAALAGTAVLASYLFGGDDFAEKAKEAKKELEELEAQLERVRKGAILDIRTDIGRADSAERFSNELRLLEAETKRLTIAEQIAAIERERQRNIQKFEEDTLTGKRFEGLDFPIVDPRSARQAVKQLPSLGFDASTDDLEYAENLAERIAQFEERQIELRKSKISLLKTENNERQKLIEKAESELAAARAAKALADERVESAEARFGRLGVEDQIQARQLAKKLNEGEELSTDEAKFAERIGFFQKQSEDTFKKRGVESGAADVIALSDAGAERKAAEREFLEAQQRSNSDLIQSQREAFQRGEAEIKQKQDGLIDAFLGYHVGIIDAIERLEDEMNRRIDGDNMIRNPPT